MHTVIKCSLCVAGGPIQHTFHLGSIQDARKAAEAKRAAEEEEQARQRAANEAAAAAAAGAAASQREAPESSQKGPISTQTTPQPAAPVNPFFLQRKRSGVKATGDPSFQQLPVGGRTLPLALAPIHVQQLPQDLQSWPPSMAGMDLPSLRQVQVPTTAAERSDGGNGCGFRWMLEPRQRQQQQRRPALCSVGFAPVKFEPQRASGALRTGSPGSCAPSQHKLLQELAHQLAMEACQSEADGHVS